MKMNLAICKANEPNFSGTSKNCSFTNLLLHKTYCRNEIERTSKCDGIEAQREGSERAVDLREFEALVQDCKRTGF